MDDLDLIDLDQPRRGYRKFISCWLRRRGGETYVVDPGPASTIPHLTAELHRRGVTRLDRILLTHVHLDHGGGAGHLAAAFPEARVVVWEEAARHLVDPQRLWEGSLQVLRDLAPLFGRPLPVPADRIDPPSSLEPLGIRTFHTPGHAAHHQCYLDDGTLFVGEAAGMTCPTRGGAPYLRPATPPRFHLPTALRSLDLLLALEPAPARLAWGHHGLCEEPGRFLAAARGQLLLWTATLDGLRASHGPAWSADLQAEAQRRLAGADPWFATLADLEDDLQAREADFLRNTIEGMLGYLDDAGKTAS